LKQPPTARLERDLAAARRERDTAARAAGKLLAEKSALEQLLIPIAEAWARFGERASADGQHAEVARDAMRLAVDPDHFRLVHETLGGVPAKERTIQL
jgi:hypothetical protein